MAGGRANCQVASLSNQSSPVVAEGRGTAHPPASAEDSLSWEDTEDTPHVPAVREIRLTI